MFDKLDEVENRFGEIHLRLQDPEITKDQNRFRSLMKEYSNLEPLILKYREYKKIRAEIKSNKNLFESEEDEELKKLIREELEQLEKQYDQIINEIKILLIPKDPNDDRNIILEIRPAAGGDEAALFAEELFRGYSHYAARQGWSIKVLSFVSGNMGGAKEIIASISGNQVYSKLKYESGVHRVQRVPKTETQGRIHTSTITVAVLPESDEVEVKIDPNELRIDVYRSSGHGGQSVNTTDSAVRVTHIPSGLVVTCQDGKSQLSNKEQALKVLAARLKALEEERARKSASEARLAQIGTGDRSERIRTYNFPQSRITDHRIGLTIHSLPEVIEGNFHQLIDPITAYFQAEALKQQNFA